MNRFLAYSQKEIRKAFMLLQLSAIDCKLLVKTGKMCVDMVHSLEATGDRVHASKEGELVRS